MLCSMILIEIDKCLAITMSGERRRDGKSMKHHHLFIFCIVCLFTLTVIRNLNLIDYRGSNNHTVLIFFYK